MPAGDRARPGLRWPIGASPLFARRSNGCRIEQKPLECAPPPRSGSLGRAWERLGLVRRVRVAQGIPPAEDRQGRGKRRRRQMLPDAQIPGEKSQSCSWCSSRVPQKQNRMERAGKVRLQNPRSTVNLAVSRSSEDGKLAYSADGLFHVGEGADLGFESLVILPFDLQFGL